MNKTPWTTSKWCLLYVYARGADGCPERRIFARCCPQRAHCDVFARDWNTLLRVRAREHFITPAVENSLITRGRCRPGSYVGTRSKPKTLLGNYVSPPTWSTVQ